MQVLAQVLLRHDRPLLQLDNAAIVGQRPPAPVQNGARVPTVLRRRDIYNRDGTLADGFHVPIYEAYPRDADPPPNQHVDSSDSILSVWVPPYMVRSPT